MTLPIERFKEAYKNWRWNPFTSADMAVDATEDGLIIPSGSPFLIQLLEVPRYNDPTSVSVRCYGVKTDVDQDSGSGQLILYVTDTAGFSPADKIIIDRGGDREEERIIDTVQAGISLTVTVNLTYTHTAVQEDDVEKYIAFAETAGAPAQSQFRVDYPPDDGEGTGLVEFNQNDADKEVRIKYKATGSPILEEYLDTKISYPADNPGDDQIVGFSSGVPLWRDFAHALAGSEHTAAGLTIGHVLRASGATAFAWAQLQHGDLGGVSANQHHAQAHSLASHSSKAHSELTGIGANDHHPQAHSHAHSAITGVTSDQHHPQTHTHASHTSIGANDHHPQIHAAAHHVGGGDLVNHDSLTGFVAAEHKSLPNTIAQVLSNHTKAVHDALALALGSLTANVACRAYRSTMQSIPDDVITKVAWDAENFDVGGDFAGGTFTAPSTGLYLIQSKVQIAMTATGTLAVYIKVNGATVAMNRVKHSVAVNDDVEVATLHWVTSGHAVEIHVNQDSGGAKNLASGTHASWVDIVKLGQ